LSTLIFFSPTPPSLGLYAYLSQAIRAKVDSEVASPAQNRPCTTAPWASSGVAPATDAEVQLVAYLLARWAVVEGEEDLMVMENYWALEKSSKGDDGGVGPGHPPYPARGGCTFDVNFMFLSKSSDGVQLPLRGLVPHVNPHAGTHKPS